MSLSGCLPPTPLVEETTGTAATRLAERLRACSARLELPASAARRALAAGTASTFMRLPDAIHTWWRLDADLRFMTQIGIDPAQPVGREGALTMLLGPGDVLRVSELLGLAPVPDPAAAV